MSEHEHLQEDLAALAAGRLDGEPRRRLEEHLAQCEACAGILETARRIATVLASEREAQPGAHPSVAALRSHALGEGTAPPDLLRHVETCARCDLEVAVWRRHPARPRTAAPSRRIVTGKTLAWTAVPLALAAGLVVGLVVPRLAGRASEDVGAPVHVLNLGDAFRGGGAEAILRIGAGQRLASISVFLEMMDPTAEVGPLEFTIRTGDGRPVWSTTCPARRVAEILEAGGVFGLQVPVAELGAGTHGITVVAPGRSDVPLLERHFRVEVEQAPR
jgi:hypothetical protein